MTMDDFKVGDRVAVVLGGKTRYQRIRSLVPSIEGGVILATIIVEGREYAVGLESLRKTGKDNGKAKRTD